MHGGTPGFFPFPFPLYGPPPPRPDLPHQQVPARVRTALSWLAQATDKTAARIAVSDIAIQEVEGQRLDVEEVAAVRAAARLLTSYFDGTFAPTPADRPQAPPAVLVTCPACGGLPPAKKACGYCNAHGVVLASPDGPPA